MILSKPILAIAISSLAFGVHASTSTVISPIEATINALYPVYHYELLGDPELDYVNTMIKHHEATVVLSERFLASLSDPFLVELATSIIQTRTEYQSALTAWLESQDKNVNPHISEAKSSVGMLVTTKRIIDYQRTLKGTGNAERDYVTFLISHLETELAQANHVTEFLSNKTIMNHHEKMKSVQPLLDKLYNYKVKNY